MNIDDIINFIKNNKKFLKEKYGVEKIGIFGSFVKNNIKDESDIDIAIEMAKEYKNLHNFLELKRYLEKNLKREVDLGIESNLKQTVKKEIKSEIIYA
ncbi:MAG: nucleotidyltransferase family protein [Candidatus Cloacimonetes bacterium]|nr:nucleotidyltransferase family protein [Candidatus Cloacimonadota bacterium]